MSMIMQYIRIRDDELVRLRKLLANDPNRAFDYADELADGGGDTAPAYSRSIDTDKAWDGLAFLLHRLEGDAKPAVCVIDGGDRLTDDEWGYEAPRYLTPEQVSQAAADLDRTPFDRLAERFAPAEMTQVYPNMWDEPDILDYLRSWYESLVTFFGQAALEHDGMIIFLT